MAVLKLIWNDPTMSKIFPQRCSTHGCNLLIADICKLFKEEIEWCIRLIKFVCNHDGVFAILLAMDGSLQLLGAAETRMASQVYSSERILKDIEYLQEMWSGAPLRAYMATAKPELKQEKEELNRGLISNSDMIKRIGVFVEVEVPVRELLRKSDGHVPSLTEMAFGFEHAQKNSLLGVDKAVLEFPDLYPNLRLRVDAAFRNRRKDIVTSLCLAAAMILPKHVYVKEGIEAYDPVGGREAIRAVIMRYYTGDIDKQNQALMLYQDFRDTSGIFGAPNIRRSAEGTADDFWKLVLTTEVGNIGTELFRKLVNGYCGQGESERMNKQAKFYRTTLRNRQSHTVTQAYMELNSTYKMMEKKTKHTATRPYMECLRDKFQQIQEEVEEEKVGENDNIDQEEGVEEEEDEEVYDAVREALKGLLEAANELD